MDEALLEQLITWRFVTQMFKIGKEGSYSVSLRWQISLPLAEEV